MFILNGRGQINQQTGVAGFRRGKFTSIAIVPEPAQHI